MSGHCDFCQTWHSGSCCHPGRAELTRLRAEVARLNEERVTVRRLAELMSETCTHFPAALDDWGAGAMLGWANALHAALYPAPATDTQGVEGG